jgi:hypothetical protein
MTRTPAATNHSGTGSTRGTRSGWAARSVLAAAVVALLGCAGCTDKGKAAVPPSSPALSSTASGLGGGSGEGSPTPSRSTIITTPTPALSIPTGAKEIDKPCPYAGNDAMRNAEGDRTVRSVQLATNPVGCRYYFENDASVIIAEITVARFANSTEAFNSIVTLSRKHPEFVDDKTIGDFGSITVKLPLQGVDTWACLFSKGNLVVVAHTRQTEVGQDARNVAKLIAPAIR